MGGTFQKIEEQEVILKVPSSGKIEPKVQTTIRSEIDGSKLVVHVRPGESVKKGQLIMEISDEKIRIELNKQKSNYNDAHSKMIKAKKDFQLEQSLFKQQAVSRRDVENAKEAYNATIQSLELAKQELDLTEKKAAGAKVLSPMNGVLIKDHVERDQFISAGKDLITVAQLDKFSVRGKVDELDIAKIKEGQDALIQCDAFPGKVIQGRVGWIGAQAGEGAFAEIDVLIDIIDTQGLDLKPNLSAEVSIIAGKLPKGIIIPSKAIRSGPDGPHVLVKKLGGWLVRQPIEVAHINFGEAVIQSGLSPNQKILIPKDD